MKHWLLKILNCNPARLKARRLKHIKSYIPFHCSYPLHLGLELEIPPSEGDMTHTLRSQII